MTDLRTTADVMAWLNAHAKAFGRTADRHLFPAHPDDMAIFRASAATAIRIAENERLRQIVDEWADSPGYGPTIDAAKGFRIRAALTESEGT